MLHRSGLLPTARCLGEAFGACQGTVARPHRKYPGVILAAWPAGRVEDHEGHSVDLKGVYGDFQGRIQGGLGLPRGSFWKPSFLLYLLSNLYSGCCIGEKELRVALA